MKVFFEGVGYSNASFSRECGGELTYNWLYKQIKPYCMSCCIEFSYDEETGEGLIFGGLRTIGTFRTRDNS